MTKAEYMVVWNTEDCVDSIPKSNFDEAKQCALEILNDWANDGYQIMVQQNFSDEVREGWNQMLEDCWVAVYKYNPDKKEYEEFWSPSDEDYETVGLWGWFPVATLDALFEEYGIDGKEFIEFSDSEVSISDSGTIYECKNTGNIRIDEEDGNHGKYC